MRKTTINVNLNGKNISKDLSGDILSLTYSDNARESSDSVELTIQNRSRKWLKDWFPEKTDTLTASLSSWGGRLDCGQFLVDSVELSGGPLTVIISGVAMPSDQDFAEVNHDKTWEKAKLQDIATTIAGNSGVALEYLSEENPTIDFQTQTGESDMSFLQSLSEKHGLTMKVYSKKIILYSLEKLEQGGAVKSLRETDLAPGWKGKTTILDTSYSGCQVSYTDPNGKVLTCTETATGKKSAKLYKHDKQVGSMAEAQKIAKAKLKELNRGETTFSCTVAGDPGLVSGVCLELTGEEFGKFAGKYFIDSSNHVVSGGYTTSLELHKIA